MWFLERMVLLSKSTKSVFLRVLANLLLCPHKIMALKKKGKRKKSAPSSLLPFIPISDYVILSYQGWGTLKHSCKSSARVNIVGRALDGQEAKPPSCTSEGLPSNLWLLKDCAVAGVRQTSRVSSVLLLTLVSFYTLNSFLFKVIWIKVFFPVPYTPLQFSWETEIRYFLPASGTFFLWTNCTEMHWPVVTPAPKTLSPNRGRVRIRVKTSLPLGHWAMKNHLKSSQPSPSPVDSATISAIQTGPYNSLAQLNSQSALHTVWSAGDWIPQHFRSFVLSRECSLWDLYSDPLQGRGKDQLQLRFFSSV